jgi:predicted TIM-barrel fold metal-dependent hydrolase
VQSTVHPDICRQAATWTAAKGVDLLDAPVSGGVPAALGGLLTTFVGGEHALFDRVRPVLAEFCGQIFHMGPLGAGQITKLTNNSLSLLNTIAAIEALETAAAHGLDPERVRAAVLEGTGMSRALAGTNEHGFGTAWEQRKDLLSRSRGSRVAQKDLSLEVRLAEEAGVSGRLTAAGLAALTGERPTRPRSGSRRSTQPPIVTTATPLVTGSTRTTMSETTHRILDSDTHVIEKRDTWTSRLPKEWGDQVMHMVYDEGEQREVWKVGDEIVARGWANAFYGTTGESHEDRRYPRTQEDVHPSCYDAHERAKLMDSWGVTAAALYPNATGFSLEPFLTHPEPEIANAHISAYNDFLLEEWVAEEPGRFVPMACVAYWNLDAAVAEIERIAGKGFGGVVTTGAPQLHDQPYLREPHWDRLWTAAQAAELPIAFHVGNGDPGSHKRPGEDYETMETRISTAIYLDNAMQMTDLLLSGILARFPKLDFVISESGMGWVPFVLASLDQRFKREKCRAIFSTVRYA